MTYDSQKILCLRRNTGAGTPEHDSLPCGLGSGLSFRYQSAMVSIKRRLYLAAMYLLDFYFPFRFLRTAATLVALPQNRVRFGVLTLIGSCMLLMIPAEKVLQKCRPLHGLIFSITLFLLTKNINQGYLGFSNWNLLPLPDSWYHNFATTYLGFPMPGFHSADYFSLLPWVFLYSAGYFTHQLFTHCKLLPNLESSKAEPLEWIGRHSLGLYMIHQPLLYFLFTALFAL